MSATAPRRAAHPRGSISHLGANEHAPPSRWSITSSWGRTQRGGGDGAVSRRPPIAIGPPRKAASRVLTTGAVRLPKPFSVGGRARLRFCSALDDQHLKHERCAAAQHQPGVHAMRGCAHRPDVVPQVSGCNCLFRPEEEQHHVRAGQVGSAAAPISSVAVARSDSHASITPRAAAAMKSASGVYRSSTRRCS